MSPGSKKRNAFLIYTLLLVVLVGLVLISYALITIANQRSSRLLEMENRFSNLANQVTADIETEINSEFRKSLVTMASLGIQELKNREILINRLRDLLLTNPDIRYPFLFDSSGSYLFPLSSEGGAKAGLLDELKQWEPLDIMIGKRSPAERSIFREAVGYFDERKFLLAIKAYLKLLDNMEEAAAKIQILSEIARCYRENGSLHQAIAYLDDIDRMVVLLPDKKRYRHFEFKALYDKAFCYKQLGILDECNEIFLDLYDRILKHEKLTGKRLHAPFKQGALNHLRKYGSTVIAKARARSLELDFSKDKQNERWRELMEPYSDPVKIYREGDPAEFGRLTRQNPRFRLDRIRGFYLNSDEKTRFYTELLKRKYWELSDPAGAEIRHDRIALSNDSLTILYGKLQQAGNDRSIYFGYALSRHRIEKKQLDQSRKRYLAAETLSLVPEGAETLDPDIKKDRSIAVSPFKRFYPDDRLHIVSKDPHYLDGLVNKELNFNYLILLFLFIMMVLGLFLFIRTFNRERILLKMKSDFVDSVSHTLKTPLTRIRLISEKLELGWTRNRDFSSQALKTIQTETELMSESIENMLNFSKIDSGKHVYIKGPMQIVLQLNKLIDHYRNYLVVKGFDIETEIDDTIPEIQFDPEAFKMIFINLMQNAIKYSGDARIIHFELLALEDRVQWRVSDRGIGIPKKQLQAVFDKFVRADDRQVRSIEGSGLGLYLVRHAIMAHGGRVRLENRKGGGLTVQMEIPFPDKPLKKEK